jgi:hypothetical protein
MPSLVHDGSQRHSDPTPLHPLSRQHLSGLTQPRGDRDEWQVNLRIFAYLQQR